MPASVLLGLSGQCCEQNEQSSVLTTCLDRFIDELQKRLALRAFDLGPCQALEVLPFTARDAHPNR